jgi:hypothetical protein
VTARGLIDPRVIVGLEGLGQLKDPVTSKMESMTFWLVAWFLNNEWCYCVASLALTVMNKLLDTKYRKEISIY